MTGQWGRLVYRHRRLVATLTLLAAASSLLFAARASSDLSPGGWLVRGTEAAAVTDSLATAFGETGSSLIVLFRTLDGALITDAQPQAAVSTSLAALADHPAVAGITRWEESRPVEGLVSNDGTQTYAVVDHRCGAELRPGNAIAVSTDLRASTFGLTGLVSALPHTAGLRSFNPETAERSARHHCRSSAWLADHVPHDFVRALDVPAVRPATYPQRTSSGRPVVIGSSGGRLGVRDSLGPCIWSRRVGWIRVDLGVRYALEPWACQ